MDFLNRFLNWHEQCTYKWIEKLEITEYQAMWWAFFEGLVLALLLVWIF